MLVPAILIFILGIFSASPAYAKKFTVDTGGTFYPDTSQTSIFGNSIGYSTDTTTNTNTNPTAGLNPVPTISQISPSSASANTEVLTITVTGSKFMQGSIGQVNGENRTTNYIKDKDTGRISSTVLTMVLTKDDLVSGKPLTITIFNPAPGGGTSNSILFNDKSKANGSNLAAAAIFGSNSFMPKSFIQWLMLFALIFLVIVLFRKAYNKKKKYMETPLKQA